MQSKNKRSHITRKMKLKVGKNLTNQSNESSIVVPAPIGDLLPTVILTAAPTSNSSSALAPFQESYGIQSNLSTFMAQSTNSSLTLPIPQENLTLVNLSSHSALSYNSTSMFSVQSMSSSQEAKVRIPKFYIHRYKVLFLHFLNFLSLYVRNCSL